MRTLLLALALLLATGAAFAQAATDATPLTLAISRTAQWPSAAQKGSG